MVDLILNKICEVAPERKMDVLEKEIIRCIEEKRIICSVRNDKLDFVLCWKIIYSEGKMFIKMFNLWISNGLRDRNNLLILRSFFKGKYPESVGWIWFNRRRSISRGWR